MLQIGKYNTVQVERSTPQGLYLVDSEGEEVLLPNAYIPEDLNIGDEIEVFVYLDSDARIIATTLDPKIQLHEFAYLEVKQVTEPGAFLDWGLAKDLFVPFREQHREMRQGEKYVVFLYEDELTERLVASSRVNVFLERDEIELSVGEEVDLLIYEKTDLGFNAIINNKYRGLIYENEVFSKINIGDKLKGFVKLIREDNKVDLTLHKFGYRKVEPNADKIMEALSNNGGTLPYTDKTDPEIIKNKLGMSKKVFKKALGLLYKQKLVNITDTEIQLLNP